MLVIGIFCCCCCCNHFLYWTQFQIATMTVNLVNRRNLYGIEIHSVIVFIKSFIHKEKKNTNVEKKLQLVPFGCESVFEIPRPVAINEISIYIGCFCTIGFYDFRRDKFNGILFVVHIRAFYSTDKRLNE